MGAVLGFPGVDPADAAVGARLKRWREQRGEALETLAEALSLSPEALKRAEAGREHLSSLQLQVATCRLHLPVWALVSDTRAY
jgi:transcriptional regulator with XRE-family HTH domain